MAFLRIGGLKVSSVNLSWLLTYLNRASGEAIPDGRSGFSVVATGKSELQIGSDPRGPTMARMRRRGPNQPPDGGSCTCATGIHVIAVDLPAAVACHGMMWLVDGRKPPGPESPVRMRSVPSEL